MHLYVFICIFKAFKIHISVCNDEDKLVSVVSYFFKKFTLILTLLPL